jgi:16S rRNA (guanine527-N7)-methyltransferase
MLSIMQELIDGATRLGIELTTSQIDSFETYFKELTDWNTRVNLTSIVEYKDVQIKHYLDSLTPALALPRPLPAGYRLLDVGSGGGFPGIPLKIVFPQIELVLLEATGKKVEFLKHMVEKLSLTDSRVVLGRAEEAGQQAEFREQFDCVVTRGLAPLAVLAELTLPFCKVGGRLIAQKKGDIAEELKAGAKAVRLMGGKHAGIVPIDLPEFTDNRCLVVVEKGTRTHPMYPRRNGVPSKNPLG